MPTSPRYDDDEDTSNFAKLDKLVAVLTERFEGLSKTVARGFETTDRKLDHMIGQAIGRQEFDNVTKDFERRMNSLEASRNWIALSIIGMFLLALGGLVWKGVSTPAPTVEIHSTTK